MRNRRDFIVVSEKEC